MVKICPKRLSKYMLKNRSLFIEETIDFSCFVAKEAPRDAAVQTWEQHGFLPVASHRWVRGRAWGEVRLWGWAGCGAGCEWGPGSGPGVAARTACGWELVNERKRTVIAHLHMLLIVDLGIFYEYSFTKQMLFKKRGNIILWAMN